MSSKVAWNIEQIIHKTAEIATLAAELSVVEQTKAKVSETELSKWLARIYDDQSLTNIEFQQLRDEADQKLEHVKERYPDLAELAVFQKAADDAVQQMQVGILKFKSKKLPKDAKSDVQQAYAFQVAYIKACLDRFTQML
jgi:hypothetical protein